MDKARDFCQTLLASMGVDPTLVDLSGVTVAGDPERSESHVTAGYRLGAHFVVTCDPAVEEMLHDATSGSNMEPTLDGFRAVADRVGGEFLGASRMQLRETAVQSRAELPAGYSYRALDKTNDHDLELISALIEESDDDELDDAEIELDNLDDVIEAVLAPSGEIAAFASCRPFTLAPSFGDIGVITHHQHRRAQLGQAVVASLGLRQASLGIEPLYRCDEENTASVGLSAKLGFRPVTQLLGYRFTAS